MRGGASIMSIATIPQHVLHGPARWSLTALAYLGHEVVVFQAHRGDGDDSGYRLWIESLAQLQPSRYGRLHLDDWRDSWRRWFSLIVAGK